MKCCAFCGNKAITKYCSDKCSKYKFQIKSLSYFGFNKSVIGTSRVFDEYERVVNILKLEYYDNKLSLPQICEKYNYPDYGTLGYFLKNCIGFTLRNKSESNNVALISGRRNINYKLPNSVKGKHLTWMNGLVTYRSTYELQYLKILDSKKIIYKVEPFRIQYFDSILNKHRISVPDLFIPDNNCIIEIKSGYLFHKFYRNNIDKFTAYIKLGYNVKMVLNHQEYIICQDGIYGM